MPTAISLGTPQAWGVVLVVILFLMWLFFGNQDIPFSPVDSLSPESIAAIQSLRQGRISTIPAPRMPQFGGPPPPPSRFVITPSSRPATTPPSTPITEERYRSIGERYTCEAMEALLGRKVLRSYRPSFLRNPETGRNLEYDCYDPVEKIACEYNGAQHYSFTPRFHKSERDFVNQVHRDQLKVKLSEENGVVLIRIPYIVDVCDPDGREACGYKYNPKIKREERALRIRRYLQSTLKTISIGGQD